jgi:flagellar biosynthesis component FlhA
VKFKAEILIAVIVAWAVALVALAAGMPSLPVIVLALITSRGVFRLLKNHDQNLERERRPQLTGR